MGRSLEEYKREGVEEQRAKDPSGNNNLVETIRTLEREEEATCSPENSLRFRDLGKTRTVSGPVYGFPEVSSFAQVSLALSHATKQ